MADQRRIPQNLQGLLHFCMEVGDKPDASSVEEMGEEQRSFLREALNGMTVDVVQRLRSLIRQLLDYVAAKEGAEAEALAALEELADWTDDVNISIDFMKIGGFDLIPAMLDLELDLSPAVRAQTAALVGALVQNNPPCQAFLTAHMPHVFRQLLRMADLSSEPESVRLKALFAISCSVRQHPEGLALFREQQGFAVLLRILQSRSVPLQTKAAFFLCALTAESDESDEVLSQLGLGTLCATLLCATHALFHEHLLALMCTLAGRHSGLRARWAKDTQLQAALRARLSDLCSAEEHRESLEFSRTLFGTFGWPEEEVEEEEAQR